MQVVRPAHQNSAIGVYEVIAPHTGREIRAIGHCCELGIEQAIWQQPIDCGVQAVDQSIPKLKFACHVIVRIKGLVPRTVVVQAANTQLNSCPRIIEPARNQHLPILQRDQR